MKPGDRVIWFRSVRGSDSQKIRAEVLYAVGTRMAIRIEETGIVRYVKPEYLEKERS